ncbi:AraC family transcriptional regulator [Acutalibacter sp. 1XD8-36]|uniref:AraC family transcriptional regulator n=1 Tax=Acutalibacter sp. 1XD8-36 TaxID=2320852 RepID=UPI001411DA82|nr:AraC family transcriptional regulator [Acutalibacter sp. 1XD8-36]NBJ89486.1 AraC family transcriptional regulator [Acutalibacter sp. 1XD8-36]
MNINDKYSKIVTDETLRETAYHGNEEYPFQYYEEDIWQFDFHCIDWHWHSEIEFVFVKKGTAQFLVGGKRYVLTSGMGIFINTKAIHRFEASESVIIPNIVFLPDLLSSKESLIYRKYIWPILNSNIDCFVLTPNVNWQNTVLNLLLSVFSAQKTTNSHEIKTVELLLKLWTVLYENVEIKEDSSVSEVSARTTAQLQIMMQYIHKNYSDHISLDDIAKTVSISKSSALNIFNKYLNTSPINYLVNYRLKRAARLLTNTDNSIFLIAQATGFENVGYFCRKFKKLFQLTPSEYRKKAGFPYSNVGKYLCKKTEK